MKLFKVRTNLTSYWHPVVKLIGCTVIICLCIFRRKILITPFHWLDTVTTVISFVMSILCILILYISVGEIFHTYANRNPPRYVLNDAVKYPICDVISMIENEDIIQIDLLTVKGLQKVGASSDNRYYSSTFVDKQYYIGERVYEDISEFTTAMIRRMG